MALYTGTVKNISRAPYSEQVLIRLTQMGCDTSRLSEQETQKIKRVQRFLPAEQCAREIADARDKAARSPVACMLACPRGTRSDCAQCSDS